MKKKFFILDGSSLLYRAFYALPLLESGSGEFTNAIYGFSNMLIKLLHDYKPDYLVIAFDKGKKTFRTEMFAEYKGTRKPTPRELLSQIPMLRELAEAWGINFVELAGYEADDILGTMANQAVAQGFAAYVVTGDRDALQLVKPDLHVLFTKNGISELVDYDEAVFQQEYGGLDPIQLIDLKGLMGDSSDNIPGVPGVGPKTAIKLIAAYSSVEQVLLHVEEIAGNKLKENIRNNQQQAVLSKQLATICLEAPVEFKTEECEIKINGDALVRFYSRYNIRSMLRAIKPFVAMAGDNAGETVAAKEAVAMPEVKKLQSEAEGQQLYDAVKKAGQIYIMCEFAGRVPHVEVKSAALSVANELYYVAVSGENSNGMDSLFALEENTAPAAWEYVKKLLADEAVTKYLHNTKGYYHAGVELSGKLYDMELIGYLLNPASSKYDLAELANSYAPEISAPGKDAKAEELLSWQVFVMNSISKDMTDSLEQQGMHQLYWDMELPLVRVLSDMEANGIYVNRQHLKEQTAEVGETIDKLQKNIYELAGREFNINSPKQLGELLFETLGLPVIKKTKTGYSTNVEVLQQLIDKHPIIQMILDYRMWTKLKSTYLDGVGGLIDADTQRVHTTFNQTVTATGRLSSSEPNLQNIPVRKEEGKRIRQLFEPGPGYDVLVSADYSQIELRVLADMSGDESFIRAFNHEEDIHARTAAEVFDVPMEEVTPELRRKAKAVNFGIVYGISDYGLSQDLDISRAEAKSYIESYFAKCKGVKAFIDKVVADAHTKGYVETTFGRRRQLTAINSSNFNQRSLAERMAMNTPIQGTAADIIKVAMIRAGRMLAEAGLKSRILLQVHDELVLEAVEAELPKVEEILKEAMEKAVKLSVPLTIDINVGKTWAEAK